MFCHREYIAESLGHEAATEAAEGGIAAGKKISRSALEDEARESSLAGHGTPGERFWMRQRGQEETIAMGRKYIASAAPQSASQNKKEL